MPDLKLDPTTGDLYQDANGNLAQTNDATGETLRQAIKIALRTIKGEWFLNTACGLDYRGVIWPKNPNLKQVEIAIRSVILAVPGVAGITSFKLVFNRTARSMTVTASVQGNAGAVTVQEVLGP